MEMINDEVALLVGQSGPLNGQRWPLGEVVLIGRDEQCDIVIPDRQVSRHHARITLSAEGLILEDLESKNGTYLNGSLLIEPALLIDGDSIEVALAQKFVFLSSDATVPIAQDYARLQLGRIPDDSINQLETLRPVERPKYKNRLYLDKRAHRVWIYFTEHEAKTVGQLTGEIEIDPPLSASQFRLLEILSDQQGEVVSRQELVVGVWGAEESIGVSEQALDALIRRLRDRLASVDPQHHYLVTVRGHGLRLENPPFED